MTKSIAVVLKGYPRLSETFIAQEILALEQSGLDITIVSLRHPTDRKTHPVHDEIRADCLYLPEYLHQEPVRVLKGWWRARKQAGYRKALMSWLADLRRDFTRNRFRRWGQAMVFAAERPDDTTWIYSHFIHTPSSVARYAAEISGLPWSASAHAKDIWTSPDWELSEKLGLARWTVTCTAGGSQHLKSLAPDPDRVHLVYHGLDLSRFQSVGDHGSNRDGSDTSDPARIVTVGRAVAKKGLDTLIAALALLPEDLHWTWTHIGGGELIPDMKRQIAGLGLGDRIDLMGSRAQSDVLAEYRASDVFVLPCRIAPNGDRDGLPNVLVEAQSQALPCISTPVSGVPELINDGINGWLVPPDDPAALAERIEKTLRDPNLRRELGKSGKAKVLAEFDARQEIRTLLNLFARTGSDESKAAAE